MTSKRKTIIAGNWKMNKTEKDARELASSIVAGVAGKADLPEIVLCPPFTSLHTALEAAEGSPVAVGAQTMEYRDSGAYTGEISPLMLVAMNVKYVIIGHSERRQFFGETNATVNLRLKAALKHKLIPIVCVGESLDEREEGLTDSVVRRQVAAALADLDEADIVDLVDPTFTPLVVAYEPVWAIGTGKTCEAEEANRVCGLIRSTINEYYSRSEEGDNLKVASKSVKSSVGDSIPILYGGSVKASNVSEQLALPDIDGSLVGGASLTAEEFLPIIEGGARRVQQALSAKS